MATRVTCSIRCILPGLFCSCVIEWECLWINLIIVKDSIRLHVKCFNVHFLMKNRYICKRCSRHLITEMSSSFSLAAMSKGQVLVLPMTYFFSKITFLFQCDNCGLSLKRILHCLHRKSYKKISETIFDILHRMSMTAWFCFLIPVICYSILITISAVFFCFSI